MPGPFSRGIIAAITSYEIGGHVAQAEAQAGYERASSSALAKLIGATPESLALTRNATDGVNLVAAGLQFEPSDVALTTDQEHPAVILPWSAAERRGGAKLELFPIGATPDETLETFKQALKPKPRIVDRQPCLVRDRAATARGRDVPYLPRTRNFEMVDGAQSLGQFPLDVKADRLRLHDRQRTQMAGRPQGNGLPLRGARCAPTRRPDPCRRAARSSPRFDRVALGAHPGTADWGFVETAAKFEFGTRNWHTYAALPDPSTISRRLAGATSRRIAAALRTSSSGRLARARRHALLAHGVGGQLGTCHVWLRRLERCRARKRLWNDFKLIQRRVQVPNGHPNFVRLLQQRCRSRRALRWAPEGAARLECHWSNPLRQIDILQPSPGGYPLRAKGFVADT